MKRIITGDIHLSSYSSDKIKNGLPLRLHDIFSSLNQISQYAKNNDIKYIDIIGDINNDKDIFYTRSFLLFRKWLEENRDIHITLLSGNHDMDSAGDNQISSIEGFADAPNVRIITVTEYDEENNILWVPFSKNIVQNIKGSLKAKILLSHFGVSEAQLSCGISITSDIGLKELKKFDLVILGHYHKPQQLKNIWYTGNLCHTSWNDKGEEKRFLVCDTETLNVTSIPFKDYTRYIELTIKSSEEAKSILQEEKKLKKEGHFVRVKNITDKEIIEEGVHIINSTEKDITDRGVEITMSDDEKLQKFLNIKEIINPKWLEVGKLLCSFQEFDIELKSIEKEKVIEEPKQKEEEKVIEEPKQKEEDSKLFDIDFNL